MRMAIRLSALGLWLTTTVFWFFGGPHMGWTRTREAVVRKDPVTEIEYTEWRSNFVPGLDFLAIGTGVSGVVYALTFLGRGNAGGGGKGAA